MKKKEIKLLIINLFILISTIIITYIGVTKGASKGQVGDNMYGINYLKAFTIESNIFSAFTSLLSIIYIIKNKSKKTLYPHYISTLQLISSLVLGLTFITTLLFLTPTIAVAKGDYLSLFKKDMFFYHLLNPFLTIYLFISNKDNKLTNKDIYLSYIPLFLYMIFYLFSVKIFKNFYDIYGFFYNGKYYLTFITVIVMIVVYFFMAKGLIKLHNKK